MSTRTWDIAFVGRGSLVDNATTLRALGLGKRLVAAGHRVTLYLPDLPRNRDLKAADRTGMDICLVGSARSEFVPKVRAMLKRRHDVVHCLNAGLNSYLAGWSCHVVQPSVLVLDVDEDMPLIVRPGVRRWFVRLVEAFALQTADRILCASGYLAAKLRARTTVPVEYFPYAADLEPYRTTASMPDGGASDVHGPRRVVYLGSFQAHFDLPVLLDGMARAITVFPQLHLTMVGDGPERRSLMERADQILPGRVTFPGFVADAEIPALLQGADALVLPIADTELNRSRCPNKVYQYMAARRPVITNRVGEVAAALGEHAHYFTYGSPEDFARAVGESLTAPRIVPTDRLQGFTWEHRANAYLRMLDEATA